MDGNTQTVGVVGVIEYKGVPVIWGVKHNLLQGKGSL